MNYKLRILFSFLCILLSSQSLFSQISIEKTNVDYSITLEKDSVYRILSFGKQFDSGIYTTVRYSISDFNHKPKDKALKDEIKTIKKLWELTEDSIQYDLQSLSIGYPLQYSDVLKNHIQAFINSEAWQNHVKKNGKKLNYEIIKQVILDYDVYKPLHDFLKTKSYEFSGFSTEKHGFVTKENLQKAGFQSNEIIPMPFIVYIVLRKE